MRPQTAATGAKRKATPAHTHARLATTHPALRHADRTDHSAADPATVVRHAVQVTVTAVDAQGQVTRAARPVSLAARTATKPPGVVHAHPAPLVPRVTA